VGAEESQIQIAPAVADQRAQIQAETKLEKAWTKVANSKSGVSMRPAIRVD
jgi:hypothetical protein